MFYDENLQEIIFKNKLNDDIIDDIYNYEVKSIVFDNFSFDVGDDIILNEELCDILFNTIIELKITKITLSTTLDNEEWLTRILKSKNKYISNLILKSFGTTLDIGLLDKLLSIDKNIKYLNITLDKLNNNISNILKNKTLYLKQLILTYNNKDKFYILYEIFKYNYIKDKEIYHNGKLISKTSNELVNNIILQLPIISNKIDKIFNELDKKINDLKDKIMITNKNINNINLVLKNRLTYLLEVNDQQINRESELTIIENIESLETGLLVLNGGQEFIEFFYLSKNELRKLNENIELLDQNIFIYEEQIEFIKLDKKDKYFSLISNYDLKMCIIIGDKEYTNILLNYLKLDNEILEQLLEYASKYNKNLIETILKYIDKKEINIDMLDKLGYDDIIKLNIDIMKKVNNDRYIFEYFNIDVIIRLEEENIEIQKMKNKIIGSIKCINDRDPITLEEFNEMNILDLIKLIEINNQCYQIMNIYMWIQSNNFDPLTKHIYTEEEKQYINEMYKKYY